MAPPPRKRARAAGAAAPAPAPTGVPSYAAAPTPEEFWKAHVKARRPAVVRAHPEDAEWKAGQWTNDYLKSKAGECTVRVLRRASKDDAFDAPASIDKVRFATFIAELKSQLQYLITATSTAARDSVVASPPLPALLSDIPLRPSLMGNLVPASYNLWMGRCTSTSSGLHHDYHDNLYVLLRGTKTFRLFAPADAPRMYARGEAVSTHANGLVVYRGAPQCRADGATAADLRRIAEVELAHAEARREVAADGSPEAELADKEVEAAEARLEVALASALVGHDEEDGLSGDESDDAPSGSAIEEEGVEPPPNFSRAGTLDAALSSSSAAFPLLREAPCLSVTLHAGEMLYLPCGWWHDVVSSGGEHLALNYWFHPPAVPGGGTFARPYLDDSWSSAYLRWAHRTM